MSAFYDSLNLLTHDELVWDLRFVLSINCMLLISPVILTLNVL